MSNMSIRLEQILVNLLMINDKMSQSEVLLLMPYEICKRARKYIFDFNYPIFDESYRETLETNFLMNFYVRQIGSETYNLFKQRLMTDMFIKMPLYNQFYKSTLYDIDPFISDNVEESYSRENVRNEEGETVADNISETGTNNKSVYSDTPQGLLSDKDYATNATIGDNKVNATSKQTGNNTVNSNNKETYQYSRKGNTGISLSALLTQYRDTFINVDMMLFSDLNDLFLGVY